MMLTHNEKLAYLAGLEDALGVAQYQVRGYFDTTAYLGALREWVSGALLDKPDISNYILVELHGESTR